MRIRKFDIIRLKGGQGIGVGTGGGGTGGMCPSTFDTPTQTLILSREFHIIL